MRVLVTNDDGWASPGLTALAAALQEAGHRIIVAAPDADRSGSGAAIGPVHEGHPITYEELVVDGLDAPCYSVSGPPALAVMAARLGGFGPPPELVVSGINPGPNTGRATLHSGTVGAALTAANFGVSGLAVSIGTGQPIHWSTAARVAVAATAWLIRAPRRTVLNLNVPNLAFGDLGGVRRGRLAPFGTVRAAIVEAGAGQLQIEMRQTDAELDPDTDTALVRAGMVSATVLVGLRADTALDAAGELDAELRGVGRPA